MPVTNIITERDIIASNDGSDLFPDNTISTVNTSTAENVVSASNDGSDLFLNQRDSYVDSIPELLSGLDDRSGAVDKWATVRTEVSGVERDDTNVLAESIMDADGVFTKALIMTSPTAYSEGRLHSIKPEIVLGSELVTNGGFDTDSDWTLGTGITISGGSANFTGVANANINQDAGLVTGKTYKIVFTISNYVSGDIDYNVGGATRQGAVSANGTYTDYVVSSTGQILYFQSDQTLGFTGSIDNVSVKEDISADFDFTRGSSATRVNEAGLIESVAANIPRINYENGQGHLLLEGQRTNLVTYSEDFSNAYWTKTGSSVVSGFTSPDGTANAFKLVENTSTPHSIYKLSVASPSQSKQSFSIFVKDSGDGRFVRITTNDGVNGWNYYFNPITGQEVSSTFATSKIISLPNGWYRIELMADGANYVTFGSVPFIVYLSDNGTSSTYTGDGTSGVYIFGAQVEEASYPTSYIVSNSGSATTRLAETCNNAGNSDIIPSDEGVLYFEGSFSESGRLALSNASASDQVVIGLTVGGSVFYRIKENNVNIITNFFTSENELNRVYKIAVKYQSGNCSIFVDGIKETDTNTFSLSNLSKVALVSEGLELYGKIRMIALFPYLSDDELIKLTR